MNDWKQRLISYIEKMNDSVGIDNAFSMLSEEIIRIKKEESAKPEQVKMKCDIDKKSMSLDDFIQLY